MSRSLAVWATKSSRPHCWFKLKEKRNRNRKYGNKVGKRSFTNFTQEPVLQTLNIFISLSTDSHPEFQNLEQLQIKDDQIKNDISEIGQQSLAVDSAHYSVSSICVGTYSEYPIKINRLENSKGCTFSNSLTEPLDAQPDIGTCGISPLAEEHQHTTEDKTEWKKHALSRLRAFCSKKKRFVKRSFPPLTSNTKTSTRSPASQNPSGPHCCKACGKTFHYMHTLRKHAQAHAADQIHICGICGQHLESKENLVQHLQSHRKRNKCAVCGKEFSSNARLTRHRRFHRPKGLIVPSSS